MMLRHRLATTALRLLEQVGGGAPSLAVALRLATHADEALAVRLRGFLAEHAAELLAQAARGELHELAQARDQLPPKGAPATWPRFRELLLREMDRGSPVAWDPGPADRGLPVIPARRWALVLAWRVHVAVSSAPVANHGPLFDRLAVR